MKETAMSRRLDGKVAIVTSAGWIGAGWARKPV
jgi:hypothetical protein